MNIFVAASYSSQVNYETGEVLPEYKAWLEDILSVVEELGHTVFCALRADQYRINNIDPAAAFRLDLERIEASDILLALMTDKPSAGVQTEIGVAVALKRRVILAHAPEHELGYFNRAMQQAGTIEVIGLPFDSDELNEKLAG